MCPQNFEHLNLNLPESQDELPDLLNEALWFVDFHRRTQTPAGGIRPGIESAEHPTRGEASWQESLTVMAYAPTANMSYKYAAVAAHAAHLLRDKSPSLSRGYIDSALRAFQWAEQQRNTSTPSARDGERVLAVAEFYRSTGEPKWQDMFVAATRFADAKTAAYSGHKPQSGIYDPQDEAGWVYLRTTRPGMNQTIKDNFQRALLAHADVRIADIADTAFRWVATKGKAISYSTSVIPDAVGLVRAHYLTHEVKYLKAALLACQQGAGANPLNLCYTTGVGVDFQQHMVHEDSYVSHQPLPPGLTVNGPFDPRNPVLPRHAATVNSFRRFIYPKAETWPALESYFDVGVFSPMSEFTVHRNIAPNAYVWGYLALAR
jgi:endoglucanase